MKWLIKESTKKYLRRSTSIRYDPHIWIRLTFHAFLANSFDPRFNLEMYPITNVSKHASRSKSGQWSRVTAIERDLEYVVPRPRLATRTQGISVKRRAARAAIHSAVIAWITRPEIFPTRAARHVARTSASTPTREAREANFQTPISFLHKCEQKPRPRLPASASNRRESP